MNKVSFIIVNYNGGKIIYDCIDSIVNAIKKVEFEVIIVDNDSSDNSIDLISNEENWKSRVRILKMGENLGFAKANNIGASNASGDILFFLNPDTLLEKDIDQLLTEISSSINEIVYAPKIKNKSQKFEKSYYLIPTLRNYVSYLLKRKAHYWYLGAAVIISKKVFYEVGGWPEDYFMYSEDLDLFYKIWKTGYEVKMTPYEVIHIGGGITVNVWSQYERLLKVEKALYKFHQKYNTRFDYIVIKMFHIIKTSLKNSSLARLEFKVFKNVLFDKGNN